VIKSEIKVNKNINHVCFILSLKSLQDIQFFGLKLIRFEFLNPKNNCTYFLGYFVAESILLAKKL